MDHNKNDKKVYLVNSLGGLGNQIFCYVFYKKLCHDYPDRRFLMDISGSYNKYYDRNAEFLHLFPDAPVDISSKSMTLKLEHRLKVRYKGKGHRFLIYAADFLNENVLHAPEGACVTDSQFDKWGCTIPDDRWNEIVFFDGFWQNMDYYRDIWDEITKDLVYRAIDDEPNLKMLAMIGQTESVAVHIRRGDYIGARSFDILDDQYYFRIINRIMDRNPDSTFFFFSNDPGYVEKTYEWLCNKIIVNINHDKESYKDMQLISACKTNIVANSTFSIWGAFLNRNPDRKVYYPSHYLYRARPLDYSFLHGFEKVEVIFPEETGN